MFRVDGYVSASHIAANYAVSRIPESMRQEIESEIRRGRAYTALNIETGRSEFSDDEMSAAMRDVSQEDIHNSIAMRERVIFLRFLWSNPLFLCGPNGTVVTVSKDMFFLRTWERDSRLQLLLFDDRFINLRSRHVVDLLQAYKEITRIAGSDLLGVRQKRLLDMALDGESAIRALLPFDGFSLAVSEENVPSLSDVLEKFGIENDDKGEENFKGGKAIGRPRKQEEAAAAYMDRFPTGHGGYTWKEVLKILEVECDTHVSEETLRNGLKTMGGAQ